MSIRTYTPFYLYGQDYNIVDFIMFDLTLENHLMAGFVREIVVSLLLLLFVFEFNFLSCRTVKDIQVRTKALFMKLQVS